MCTCRVSFRNFVKHGDSRIKGGNNKSSPNLYGCVEHDVQLYEYTLERRVMLVYNKGWVREGDVPPPVRSAKLKVICANIVSKMLNF